MAPDIWAVRWYLMFPVSYRDLELMLLDRGVEVDHTTIFRWIQAYATELEKRIRPHLRTSNGSWRVDETYIRVKGRWTYSIGRWTAEGRRSISFCLRGGIRPRRSGSFARPSRNRMSPIRALSPSTRILPIPERSQI
jgi:transposase, IS6 family